MCFITSGVNKIYILTNVLQSIIMKAKEGSNLKFVEPPKVVLCHLVSRARDAVYLYWGKTF